METWLLDEDGVFGEVGVLSTFCGEQWESDEWSGQGKYCMSSVEWKGEFSSLVGEDYLKGKCVSWKRTSLERKTTLLFKSISLYPLTPKG